MEYIQWKFDYTEILFPRQRKQNKENHFPLEGQEVEESAALHFISQFFKRNWVHYPEWPLRIQIIWSWSWMQESYWT